MSSDLMRELAAWTAGSVAFLFITAGLSHYFERRRIRKGKGLMH